MKILVKYASRGRPDRFFDGMEALYNNCSRPDDIQVLITADTDDPLMFNDEVRDRVATYKNTHLIYGESNGKIHATNRDLDLLPDEWRDWDIIANYSDDQRFCVYGWDEMIRADFNQHSPELTHYMAYLDVDTAGALSTLYIAGRKFFDLFGFIYNPAYISLFADNEVEEIAKIKGLYHYTGYTIYKHLLASYGHLPEDKMFREQQDIGWTIDQHTYYERKAKNFYL